MGQKANPKGLRLGISQEWSSQWFDLKSYAPNIVEDLMIRKYIKAELKKAGVSSVTISRKAGSIDVSIKAARPGVIIGKGGSDVAYIKEDLQKKTSKNVHLNIVEEKHPETSARLIGQTVAMQLEKRFQFRRAMKMAVQRAMKAGAEGIKIECSGRLGGVEIARTEWYREGRVPLHTFRANIDYELSEASTTYGIIGVKVWVYHGDILPAHNDRIFSRESKNSVKSFSGEK